MRTSGCANSAARLGLQALVIGANNPPGGKPMGGAALYDALYATGYHANLNTTRALHLNLSGALGVRSVLDVGCSHGYAVSWLWRHGIKASGLDVSSIAIAKAKAALKKCSLCSAQLSLLLFGVPTGRRAGTVAPWPRRAPASTGSAGFSSVPTLQSAC